MIVFAWGIFLLRIGVRRLLSRHAGFDILVVVIIGSVLSRGINGRANFFATLGACGVIVLCHHLLALLACRSDVLSRWLKGIPVVLVRDGQPDPAALRACRITRDDLDESLRLNGNVALSGEVKEARLERNGSISVVKR
ncbi:MAG TPA: YetF domain-containing protein [Candidatus Didemnitutus sp.]|nr:YetF domain-containing protein [Candidatus Didemnitutus sp.]